MHRPLPYPEINHKFCKNCGICTTSQLVCKDEMFYLENGRVKVKDGFCSACCNCERMCPELLAIRVRNLRL